MKLDWCGVAKMAHAVWCCARIGGRAVRLTLLVFLALASIALRAPVSAAVLIDQSPDALGGPLYGTATDSTSRGNFLVQIILGAEATISGMDIYAPSTPNSVTGYDTTIKIRAADNTGQPATTNLYSYTSSIDQYDTSGSSISGLNRYHTSFSPTTLSAGTWWIGVSGFGGWTGAWSFMQSGPQQPDSQVVLSGDAFNFCCTNGVTLTDHPSSYALAFRIDGDVAATPLPAALPLFATGLGALGLLGWRRKKKAAALAV